MKVSFNHGRYEFRPWKPKIKGTFTTMFAFDTETTLIDEAHPWLAPAYVLGAAFDGKKGFFVQRKDVAAFFQAHRGIPIVLHNASFDLEVIHTLAPVIDIYQRIDHNRIWDTQLLHRLYKLGSDGHTAGGKGESDLEHCAQTYLGVQLPKDLTDSVNDLVRLSYGKWLNRSPAEIEPIYLDYLARDVIATHQVYQELRRLLDELLARSHQVWGYVSPEWLSEQLAKWGPQTHHIQLRASIVLREITANGLHLDMARRAELAQALEAKVGQQRKELAKFGYLPGGQGANQSLQHILKRLESQLSGMSFPRTETGRYATAYDALQDLTSSVPFIKLLLEYRETEKLLGSFVNKMGKPGLHPSFNVLARTGRTSSFGEINAQNLPTDDQVRSCFIPSPGNVFIDADYKTIELATLAQACVGQFGLQSDMARAINAGKDLHAMVAARVTNKPEVEVSKHDRKKAKPINFGKPGGMGDKAMQQYAKISYGVNLTDQEVEDLSDAWFELFPEMRKFLGDSTSTPLELAGLLQLTPSTHHEHTDDTRFLRHPENAGRENQPCPILGAMLLKVVKMSSPETVNGRPYSDADLDYFWSRLEAKKSLLAPMFQDAIRNRQPSPRLQREVMSLVGRAGVFTFTGRLRAAATYTARHNTVFQGLAADGAKLALWLLWRAGYRIANFVHDQVLVEVPAGSDLKCHADRIRDLMIQGMQKVVPDIRIEVSFAAADRWYKDAEAVYDRKRQCLRLWRPQRSRERTTVAV